MVETIIPTRPRTQGTARPGARPATNTAAELHDHFGVSGSHSNGIRVWPVRLLGAIAALSTPMLSLVIAHVVAFCTRHVWPILLAAAVVAGGSGYYAARHFVINADVTQLISADLPWRPRG